MNAITEPEKAAIKVTIHFIYSGKILATLFE